MIVLRLALAVFALLSLPAMADDAVTITQRVEYYDVRGLTEETIARSLRRDAPRALDGFQGQANFVFSWTYNYRPAGERHDPGLCEVVNAKVDIDIVITLQDTSPTFDPTTLPAPDLATAPEHRRPGGMGVHLMRAAMDTVTHDPRPGGGTILTLTRRLDTESATATEAQTGGTSDGPGHHGRAD